MAGEIKILNSLSPLYWILTNSVGQFYNCATPGFEAEADANWSSVVGIASGFSTRYAANLTRQGTSLYWLGNMPSVAAGRYSYAAFQQIGGLPALTDNPVQSGTIEWTGDHISSTGIVLPDNVAFGTNGGIPTDTSITADVGTALNTAVPGSPTAGSSYAYLKSLPNDIAPGVTDGLQQAGVPVDLPATVPTGFLATDTTLLAVKAKTDALVTVPKGTVVGTPAPTATTFTATGLSTTSNEYFNSYALFITGVNAGSTAQPVAASTAGGQLTCASFPAAPSAGDTFVIIGSKN